MEFPERLARIRKSRNLTQQQLADLAGTHVVQINRYEGGVSQPAADVIKRLAIALSVSADALLFDDAERGPDDDLRLQFEALATLPLEEKLVAKSLLEAMIVKHRVSGALAEAAAREAQPLAKQEKANQPESSKRIRSKKASDT